VAHNGQHIHIYVITASSHTSVRFVVLRDATVKILIVWDITTCSSVEVHRRFAGTPKGVFLCLAIQNKQRLFKGKILLKVAYCDVVYRFAFSDSL
jgi:hypothetical protein